MTTAKANAGVSAMTVKQVIVRACIRCQGPREIGEPCARCGLPDAPVVHDVGAVAAWYRNPFKRAWWNAAGQHLAAARTRRANRYAEALRDH